MRLLAFACAAVLLTGCGVKHTPTPRASATRASQYALPCAGTRFATVVNTGRDPVTVLAYGRAGSQDMVIQGQGGPLGVVEPGREGKFALTREVRYVTISGRRSSEVTGTRGVRITYQCE